MRIQTIILVILGGLVAGGFVNGYWVGSWMNACPPVSDEQVESLRMKVEAYQMHLEDRPAK